MAVARLLSKIAALGLSALQVWVPAAVLYLSVPRRVFADPFMDAARQGQSFGRGLVPDASSLAGQDAQGNLNFNWQGQTTTLAPQQLFPDTQNTTDPNAQSTFGSDAGVKNLAQDQVTAMGDSNSQTGKAYQTLTGSLNRARVDMSHMGMWLQTDNTLTQVLNQAAFSNCEPATTVTSTTTYTHTSDYHTCERIVYPAGGCHCRHDYSVEFLGQYSVGAYATTTGNVSITVNLITGQINSSGSGPGLDVYAPPPAGVCTAPEEGALQSYSVFQPYAGASLVQAPNCSNGFAAVFNIGGHSSKNPETLHTGTFVANLHHIVDRGWTCDPGCAVFLTQVNGDNIVKPHRDCTTQQVCEDVMTGIDPDTGLPIYEQQCHDETTCTNPYACTVGSNANVAYISGSYVSQSEIYGSNPFASVGISNLCQEVTVEIGPNTFNAGQMDCWTDPQGQVHCPQNTGDQQDTCADLENNPACTFVRQECIDGAQDPGSNICYAFDVVFDCGQDLPITGQGTTTTYVCDGAIRCMGEGCVQGQFDPNNQGFAQAAAALQIAQYAQQDLDCAYDANNLGGTGCALFTGTKKECKKALGGYINCCEEPDGVSLVQYIELLVDTNRLGMANWNLTGVFPSIFATNPLNGVWTTLRSPYDFTKNFISSAWDNLIGRSLPDMPWSGIGDTFSQWIMQGAYDFVSSLSPDLAAQIFAEEAGKIVFTETFQTIISMVSFVMWLYTLYSVLDILAHLIWSCTQDELELGAKRQLKVCHYVGSRCNSDILGICLEKRDVYCCYSSPLARILQEQVRKQGLGWGSGKHPKCDGLTGPELAQVNWDQVDLSEWLGLLSIAGKLPTQKDMSIDGLTGVGAPLNFDNTTNPRPDAVQRTQERLNYTGEDLEQLRNQKDLQMWGVSP